MRKFALKLDKLFKVILQRTLSEKLPQKTHKTCRLQTFWCEMPSATKLGAKQSDKVAKTLYDETETKNDSITSLYLAVLNKSGRVSDVINIINAKMPTASNTLKAILYFYQSSISSGEVKLSYLRSSLLADPRNTDSLFAMYRYYYESGDYKKAEYYLKQVIAIEPLNKKNSRLLQDLQSKM